jgi:hypothetical protein
MRPRAICDDFAAASVLSALNFSRHWGAVAISVRREGTDWETGALFFAERPNFPTAGETAGSKPG